MKKYLILALVAAFLGICGVLHHTRELKRQNEELKANQTALLGDVEYYKTENGHNAASVQRLTLSYDELKKNYEGVCSTAKELGIKVKRLESVSRSATHTDVRIRTVVKDSIIYRDGKADSLLFFRWNDAWTDIDGEIRGRNIDLGVMSRDTITQIVHRVPHKWWFFKWGCKAIRQEMVSSNPHTKITYTEYIELKK